jgi:DNA-binding transcriptional LysR family regulator
VSQVIAKLEAELGETLVERSACNLTDAGEVLQDYAQKMLNLRKDAGAALVDLRSLHRGRLDVAANEYTCLYLLPVLDAFRREHPRIKVAVQRTLASRIADEVLSHSVEMGVVSFRPADPQVISTVVYRDELVCVMSPGHALAKLEKVSIARLGRESFIAHNVPSPLRQKVIAAFQRHKTPLQMEVELPSLEAIKRFVQRGNGVALVPKLTVEHELETGSLVAVQVPELQVERKLRLVHRKQAALSHAAKEFLRVVQAHAAEHGDPFCFELEKG